MESIGDFFDNAKKEVRRIFGNEKQDKTYESHQTFPDRATTEKQFAQSVGKLLNVDAWSDLPGLTSTFELYNKEGEKEMGAVPKIGDYIRIVLPGPFPENWVEVIQIQVLAEEAELTVRPSSSPTRSGEDVKQVEHFFTKDATSTFRVEMKGNTLSAFEIGKNEGINNKGEEAGDRAVVNTVIAEGGAAGFQSIQWNTLTDYLVHLV
jgi:hypothetical protein